VISLYHLLTFDKEVEWIWTLKWRLPKFLFLINNYAISPLIILTCIAYTIDDNSSPYVWNITGLLTPWVAVLSFATAEAVFVIRVCALYGHQKLFVRLLTGFFALVTITVIVMIIPLLLLGAGSAAGDIYGIWIPFTIFDGILMLLTLYKVWSFRDGHSPTLSLVARDAIVYFVVLFAILVINLTLRIGLDFGLMFLAECTASISLSRMMINIRGLVLDDPDHTVHLRTLTFVSNGSSNDPQRDTNSATYEIA